MVLRYLRLLKQQFLGLTVGVTECFEDLILISSVNSSITVLSHVTHSTTDVTNRAPLPGPHSRLFLSLREVSTCRFREQIERSEKTPALQAICMDFHEPVYASFYSTYFIHHSFLKGVLATVILAFWNCCGCCCCGPCWASFRILISSLRGCSSSDSLLKQLCPLVEG